MEKKRKHHKVILTGNLEELRSELEKLTPEQREWSAQQWADHQGKQETK